MIAQTVVEDEEDAEGKHDKKTATNKPANKQESEGIRYMITHILYKDQIQHLVSRGLWPGHDPNFVSSDARAGPGAGDVQDDDDDGIVYQDYDSGEDGLDGGETPLFVNTNRIANLALEDSSSSSSDEED